MEFPHQKDNNTVCISIISGLFILGALSYIVIIVLLLTQLYHGSIDNIFSSWPTLNGSEYYVIMMLPWMILFVEIIWLRLIWKPRNTFADSRIYYGSVRQNESRGDSRRAMSLGFMQPSRTRYEPMSRSWDKGAHQYSNMERLPIEESLFPKIDSIPATYQQIERADSENSRTSSQAAHPELENFMFELDFKIDNWLQREKRRSFSLSGENSREPSTSMEELGNEEKELETDQAPRQHDSNVEVKNTPTANNMTQPYNPFSENSHAGHVALNVQVPGEVAGEYTKDWWYTFDLTFVAILILSMIIIFLVAWEFDTYFLDFTEFWIIQLPKVAIIWVVSIFCGLICRRYCPVDQYGYIITSRKSWFKINYTHKVCCLVVYITPLFVRPSPRVGSFGLICDLWVVLAALVVLIKPIREKVPLFMLMFNAVDRPEDRPHSLEWMIAGNIFPGFLVILLFQQFFLVTYQTDLLFILVISTGVGDGLSEPIGIYLGKHKYTVASWNHKRRYQRTMESSACMLFVTMLVITLSWRGFKNAIQFFACQAIVPILATSLEAISPHPMNTPITMFASGLAVTFIISFL